MGEQPPEMAHPCVLQAAQRRDLHLFSKTDLWRLPRLVLFDGSVWSSQLCLRAANFTTHHFFHGENTASSSVYATAQERRSVILERFN